MSCPYNIQGIVMMNNRGIAIFISLMLLFLLSLLAAAVLLTAYNYTQITDSQIKRLKAIALAESGINYAYWQLRIDSDYSGSTVSIGSDNVVITVTGPVSGRYTIKSKVTY